MTIAAGTVLLFLEKSDFLSSFSRNHESIAEVSIRLQGIDTPLLHIMRHSKGYHHFLEFLKSEMAPEGGIFWHRIDHLEDTCAFWNLLQNPTQSKALSSSNPRKYDPNMSTSRVKVPYPSSHSLSVLGCHEDGLVRSESHHSHKHSDATVDTSHLHVEHMKHLIHLTDEIMQQHIFNESQYQINLPATMIKKILSDYEAIHAKMAEELKSKFSSPSSLLIRLQRIPSRKNSTTKRSRRFRHCLLRPNTKCSCC